MNGKNGTDGDGCVDLMDGMDTWFWLRKITLIRFEFARVGLGGL
jgi:hypothetical protein